MPKAVNTLMTPVRVAALIKKAERGVYADSHVAGLALVIEGSGAAWRLRFQHRGRRRDLGLGSARQLSLGDARELARERRRTVLAGLDENSAAKPKRDDCPVAHATESSQVSAEPQTFETAARRCHAVRSETIRNLKSRRQWLTQLETYVFPVLGNLPVPEVTSPRVIEAIAPIWHRKPETARKVLVRIGVVLRWAEAMQWVAAVPNLTGAVEAALRRQATRDAHHPAVAVSDASRFMSALLSAPGTTGRHALRFLILTAARSGEVRGMTWREIDLEAALWRIPACRMKAGREHVVPLSGQALSVLQVAAKAREMPSDDTLVFPGKNGAPLSDMTIKKAHQLISPETVPHGWRSCFRDWGGELTEYPSDLLEMALAHTVGDRTVRAYRRGAMIERRREVAQAWADYVDCAVIAPRT